AHAGRRAQPFASGLYRGALRLLPVVWRRYHAGRARSRSDAMSGDVEHPALATPEGMGDFSWRVSDEYRAILRSGVYLTPATHCARCIEAGHPEHYGSPRTCGFDASGAFKARNWSCATLDELRRIAYDSEHATRWNDISVAVMPLEYGFIVLHYHKDYG